MATAVIMPRQGQSVESCVIGEWFKKVGDDVGEGELLFSYETDKAVFEEAAKVSGKLLAVFFGVGDDVPCLETVAVIGAEGEDISGVAPKVEAEPEQREKAPAEALPRRCACWPETGERCRWPFRCRCIPCWTTGTRRPPGITTARCGILGATILAGTVICGGRSWTACRPMPLPPV